MPSRLPDTTLRKRDLALRTDGLRLARDLVCVCGAGAISEHDDYMICGQCGRVWPCQRIRIHRRPPQAPMAAPRLVSVMPPRHVK